MTLSEAEKKKRRAEINHRYYIKKKQAAFSGDFEAQQKWKKDQHSRQYASIKAFIKNKATKKELQELSDLINKLNNR